nr:MAG TPA: hypothetical protein [Caudoviricetes sp.]
MASINNRLIIFISSLVFCIVFILIFSIFSIIDCGIGNS